MTTGYCARLNRGPQSFPDFIRGFRNTDYVHESRDKALAYHDGRLAEARAEIAEAEAWTHAEAERRAATAYEEAVKARRERADRRAAVESRYTAMLAKVDDWHPPADLRGLQSSMRSQLEENIRFDCREYTEPEPVRETGEEHRRSVIRSAARTIEYSTRQRAEEALRWEDADAYLRALDEALAALEAEPRP